MTRRQWGEQDEISQTSKWRRSNGISKIGTLFSAGLCYPSDGFIVWNQTEQSRGGRRCVGKRRARNEKECKYKEPRNRKVSPPVWLMNLGRNWVLSGICLASLLYGVLIKLLELSAASFLSLVFTDCSAGSLHVSLRGAL